MDGECPICGGLKKVTCVQDDCRDYVAPCPKCGPSPEPWDDVFKLHNEQLASRDAELARLRDEVERLNAARKGFVVVYPCDYSSAGIGPVHDTRKSAQQEIDEFDGRDKCYLFIEEVEF